MTNDTAVAEAVVAEPVSSVPSMLGTGGGQVTDSRPESGDTLRSVAIQDETPSSIGRLRMSMRSSSDPRAARTRQSILAAVHVLAGQGKESITVGDIVAQARISRSSFYTQFAGLDELALSVLSEALDEIGAGEARGPFPPRPAEADVAHWGTTAFVRHIDGHRALYASVFRLPFSQLAYAQFVDALAGHIAWSIDSTGLAANRRSVLATSAYMAGGMLAVLRLWLQGEIEGTAEEIVEELLALRPAGMSTEP